MGKIKWICDFEKDFWKIMSEATQEYVASAEWKVADSNPVMAIYDSKEWIWIKLSWELDAKPLVYDSKPPIYDPKPVV